MYKTKSVNFNFNDPKDVALWERMKQLGHGEFSELSKQMWSDKLKEGKDIEHKPSLSSSEK